MKKILLSILLCALCFASYSTNYYIDSKKGSNGNIGTQENKPWKTLNMLNAVVFKPGDVIHFKRGGYWKGSFQPEGSGNKMAPIIVKAYGDDPNAPIIDGKGMVGKGVIYLYNQSYWEINDLEIINDSKKEGDRRGVCVEAGRGAGVLSHIYLKNLHIHHIKGIVGQSREAKRTSGIAFSTLDITSGVSRFDDIWIDGCVIHDCDNQGIVTEWIRRGEPYPGTSKWHLMKITNARITNNLIYNISKNAMILRLFENGLVENNLCHNTATGYDGEGMTGNTIFTAACEATVFQFNEGYANISPGADGSLYDADLQSPNTVWQYSYSHHNAHGLFWTCTVQQDSGIICRNNISYKDKNIIFCINYPITFTEMYNNTVLLDSSRTPLLISERRKGGEGTRAYSFKNNIIYGQIGDRNYLLREDGYTRDISDNEFFEKNPMGENSIVNKYTSDPEIGAYRYAASEPKATMAQMYSDNFSLSATPIKTIDNLEIELDKAAFGQNINIKVFSNDGIKVYEQDHASSDKYSLEGVFKGAGVYWVVLKSGDTIACKKVWVI